MKNLTTCTVGGSIIALLLAACGGAEGESFSAAEGAVDAPQAAVDDTQAIDGENETEQAAERTLLAQFDVADTTITFVENRSGEATVLAVEVLGKAQTQSPIQRISAERDLTMLEMFYAFAPEGSEAPEALRTAHSEQAAAFGREDVQSVLEVAFDQNTPVEKSASGCSNLIFNYGSWVVFNKKSKNSQSGASTLYVGDSSSFRTTNWVTVGACNDDTNSTLQARADFDMDGDSVGWQTSPWYDVGPGGYFLYYPWRMNVGYACGGGGLTLTCLHGTRYRVKGDGDYPYHLKTAELHEEIR